MPDANDIQPTLLMVGQGEPMDAALRLALDRHGLRVEECSLDVKSAVRMAAPDVVLLVGDAAADGGRVILDLLAIDPVTSVVPVIVLGHADQLDARVTAFRSGAVAVVQRTASADQMATRVAEVTRELSERGDVQQDQLGEATFDELVSMVAQELRSGILSVGRANKVGEPMRIVLGAGRPVADAVEEFVRKLRPLVSRAEPLVYELHASTGGPVGLLDPEPGGHGDLSVLAGLRIILVDADASRVDTLAQELRAHGAVVAVADPSARGLDRARGLDPEVVIVDAAGIEGPGFEVVRAIRGDVRLRWAAMLVAPWADIWPETAHTPDLTELVERIRPLVVHDRALRERATKEPSFDTRLEATGPSRLLRVLASLPGPFHVSLRNRKAHVEVDVAEGLVVGARATRAAGDVIEGTRALAAMLAMASSRVHVEKRANPSLANLMAPVEEALAQASLEAAPIPVSSPPPPLDGGLRGARPKPFPAASEVSRGVFDDDADSKGPRRGAPVPRPAAFAARADATSRDLKWTDSESGEAARPSTVQVPPQGLFTSASPSIGPARQPALRPRAALSAFGESKPLFPPAESAKSDDSTRIYASEELARAAQVDVPPPRRPSAPPDPGTLKARSLGPPHDTAASARPTASKKNTLVMGAQSEHTPAVGLGRPARVAPPSMHSPTLTMGTAEPSAPPPPPPTADLRSAPSRSEGPRSLVGVLRDSVAPASATEFALSSSDDELDTKVDLFDDPQIPPSTPRARVDTPMLARLAGPVGSTGRVEQSLEAPALPPLPPAPPSAPTQAPPSPSSAGARPPSSPPSSTSRRDPAPLGVISAPAPPSGVPVGTPTGRPSPAPDHFEVGAAPEPVPVASVPRASPGRGLAWLLVALSAATFVGVAGWIGWTRYGALIVGDGGDGSGTLAAADDVDAALLVGALAEPDAAEALVDGGEATLPIDAGQAAPAPAADSGVTAEPVDAGVDAAEPEPVAAPEVDTGGDADALVARAEGLPDAQAEGLYRRAIALDDRNHYAMLGLAGVLMRRGAPEEAIPFIEGAIRRRGRRAEYRVMLGDARRDAGDAAGARAAWREALTIDPDQRDARARLSE